MAAYVAHLSDHHQTVRRSVSKPQVLNTQSKSARMEKVEDELVGKVFDSHPNRQRAFDRLMGDLEDVSCELSSSAILPLETTAEQLRRIEQIENLLVAATVNYHPNSQIALEALLDDVVGDAPTLPSEFFDSDWDGLA